MWSTRKDKDQAEARWLGRPPEQQARPEVTMADVLDPIEEAGSLAALVAPHVADWQAEQAAALGPYPKSTVVEITLRLNVGVDPTADAITYFIYQYGSAPGDDTRSPEEWAEAVVLDVLGEYVQSVGDNGVADWRITDATVKVVER